MMGTLCHWTWSDVDASTPAIGLRGWETKRPSVRQTQVRVWCLLLSVALGTSPSPAAMSTGTAQCLVPDSVRCKEIGSGAMGHLDGHLGRTCGGFGTTTSATWSARKYGEHEHKRQAPDFVIQEPVPPGAQDGIGYGNGSGSGNGSRLRLGSGSRAGRRSRVPAVKGGSSAEWLARAWEFAVHARQANIEPQMNFTTR